MKVVSLALGFFNNIVASGHQFVEKILSETCIMHLFQFMLANNIAHLEEDIMFQSVSILWFVTGCDNEQQLADRSKEDIDELLETTIGVALTALLHGQSDSTLVKAAGVLANLADKHIDWIPKMATFDCIRRLLTMLETRDPD